MDETSDRKAIIEMITNAYIQNNKGKNKMESVILMSIM